MSQSSANPSGQAIRVFIAAPIPLPDKLVLSNVMDALSSKLAEGVRWVNPDGIHLTIKFLGDINPSQASVVAEAMGRAAAQVSPFRIGLSGLGMFPNQKKPRVLWAGVEGDMARLTELQEATENELTALGFPKDRRSFNPHLTLGRVRDQVLDRTRRRISLVMSGQDIQATEPWLVESVGLIQTHFGPAGTTYTTMSGAFLKGVRD